MYDLVKYVHLLQFTVIQKYKKLGPTPRFFPYFEKFWR